MVVKLEERIVVVGLAGNTGVALMMRIAYKRQARLSPLPHNGYYRLEDAWSSMVKYIHIPNTLMSVKHATDAWLAY